MSANVTTRMVGETMLVTVKGEPHRATARKLAQQAAGTAFIGATQGDGPYTFEVSAKSLAARKTVRTVPPARTLQEAPPVDALSAALASLDPAVAKLIREHMAPVAPVTVAGDLVRPVAGDVATVGDLLEELAVMRQRLEALTAGTAPNTFVQDVILPKRERKAAAKAAASCKTCMDYGIVRAGGKRKGEPYDTANGAKGAANPAPCPACKGKGKRTA